MSASRPARLAVSDRVAILFAAPLNVVGDCEGAQHDPETNDVKTPTGFKEAYQTYAEAGWQSLSVPTEYGGQG